MHGRGRYPSSSSVRFTDSAFAMASSTIRVEWLSTDSALATTSSRDREPATPRIPCMRLLPATGLCCLPQRRSGTGAQHSRAPGPSGAPRGTQHGRAPRLMFSSHCRYCSDLASQRIDVLFPWEISSLDTLTLRRARLQPVHGLLHVGGRVRAKVDQADVAKRVPAVRDRRRVHRAQLQTLALQAHLRAARGGKFRVIVGEAWPPPPRARARQVSRPARARARRTRACVRVGQRPSAERLTPLSDTRARPIKLRSSMQEV